MNDDQLNLQVSDLAVLKSIIEVCSQRGAIQPDEMSTVGRVYDKLNVFLDSLAPPPEPEPEPESEPELDQKPKSVARQSNKKPTKE